MNHVHDLLNVSDWLQTSMIDIQESLKFYFIENLPRVALATDDFIGRSFDSIESFVGKLTCTFEYLVD